MWYLRWSDASHGSSPLARGTRWRQPPWHQQERFIPAGAGNTEIWASATIPMSVHPRWRGEHGEYLTPCPATPGSSPLARGTLPHVGNHGLVGRFIPAGAGNTLTGATRAEARAVHPRWRGEHGAAGVRNRPGAGSSPLARGTRGHDRLLFLNGRFIPAGAGNTADGGRLARAGAVHPRWRGEHCEAGLMLRKYGGSSPLARGTQKAAVRYVHHSRFIPAGAGNTGLSDAWSRM